MRKGFLFIFLSLISVSCAGWNNPQPIIDKTIDFTLSINKESVCINDEVKIEIKLKDEKDKIEANFSYTLNDNSLLKENSFVENVISFTAIKEGTEVVTITENKYKKAHDIKFNIKGYDLIGISLSEDNINLTKEKTKDIIVNPIPEKALIKNFSFSNYDNNIISVNAKEQSNKIEISGLNEGKTSLTITAIDKYENKFSAQCDIEIFEPFTISLSEHVLNLKIDDTFLLNTGTVDKKNLLFSSSDNNVATIDSDGNIKAVNEGEARINVRAKFDESIFANCEIHVVSKDAYLPNKTVIKENYYLYNKHSYFNNTTVLPSSGNLNLLIIPVWFTDSSDYITTDENKENVRNDIYSAYLGSNDEVGYRSVKTYYEEESGGKLEINGQITNWYDTNSPSSNYKNDSSESKQILRDAVEWARNSEKIDMKNFDLDEDGFIDGVILIYGRPAYLRLGESKNNFWAYRSYDTYASSDIDYPTGNTFFWASYDFIYKWGDDYTTTRVGTNYGGGNTYRQILDCQTFIHETGHMFGLNDYYDYNGKVSPAGAFTMQDENVSTHDPFSYISLNWADPYIPKESCSITIGEFTTSHDVILLTPDWNAYDSAFDEYLLLELYSITGLNEHYKGDWFESIELPDGLGVRLWHVDSRVISFYSGYNWEYSPTVEAPRIYKLCDNTSSKINSFPSEQRGSFLYANQNQLQLISKNKTLNRQKSYKTNFYNGDLFLEGDTFSLEDYKYQFIDNNGEFYTDEYTDIYLNNSKKLNWSFKVNKIKTNEEGFSTATISLNKLS